MKRVTSRDKTNQIALLESEADALVKLAAYEDFHEEVLHEFDRINKQIDERKLQGKTKGVTVNQLIAQKMSLQNILLYLKRFGIDE